MPNDLKPIILLKPKFDKETSLKESLEKRRTIREISEEKLSLQALSNLLWAAYGINRAKGPFKLPGRTAASASSSQEIDIYVSLERGTYLYDAFNNQLIPVASGDLRLLAINKGQEDLMANAPVQLIYVVDIEKLRNTKGYQEPGLHDKEIQKSYYFVDTGIIASNVYLFAASQGLASWFHNCRKAELEKKLNLSSSQKVLFSQTVGYPIKK
jgi:SagB-type dehydrogenase family enzyme